MLDCNSSLVIVKQVVARYGKPNILNSDLGSQFTCLDYVPYLKNKMIPISMDGKVRAMDNIDIESFSITKYHYIYLNPTEDWITLYKGISHL